MLSLRLIILSENDGYKSLLKAAASKLVRCRPTADLYWHDCNNLEIVIQKNSNLAMLFEFKQKILGGKL